MRYLLPLVAFVAVLALLCPAVVAADEDLQCRKCAKSISPYAAWVDEANPSHIYCRSCAEQEFDVIDGKKTSRGWMYSILGFFVVAGIIAFRVWASSSGSSSTSSSPRMRGGTARGGRGAAGARGGRGTGRTGGGNRRGATGAGRARQEDDYDDEYDDYDEPPPPPAPSRGAPATRRVSGPGGAPPRRGTGRVSGGGAGRPRRRPR